MTAPGQTAFGQNLCFGVLATFGQMCSCIWLGVFLCSVVVVCGIFGHAQHSWGVPHFLGRVQLFCGVLAKHPFHPFAASMGEPGARPHRTVFCTLRRLIEQAGGYAYMERHVPELYDWVSNDNETAPEIRFAILDVVSWFLGVLQQLWIHVSVRCPHAERYNESASKPGSLQLLGKRRKRSATEWPCERWSSRLMEDWASKAPSCCVIW